MLRHAQHLWHGGILKKDRERALMILPTMPIPELGLEPPPTGYKENTARVEILTGQITMWSWLIRPQSPRVRETLLWKSGLKLHSQALASIFIGTVLTLQMHHLYNLP